MKCWEESCVEFLKQKYLKENLDQEYFRSWEIGEISFLDFLIFEEVELGILRVSIHKMMIYGNYMDLGNLIMSKSSRIPFRESKKIIKTKNNLLMNPVGQISDQQVRSLRYLAVRQIEV